MSPYGAVGAAGRLGPDLASLSLVPTPRTPFEVVRARRAASVVVHGAGRVGASLATLLAAAGVGQVHVADRGPVRPGDVAPAGVAAADVDRSRIAAAAEALRRAAPEIRSTPPAPGRRPDLVVLASTEPVDTMLRTALAGGRVTHLVAGVRETTAVVGPLVLPGRTGCLRCGDLHRADRDPAWPVVAAQLVGHPSPPGGAMRRGVGHGRRKPRRAALPCPPRRSSERRDRRQPGAEPDRLAAAPAQLASASPVRLRGRRMTAWDLPAAPTSGAARETRENGSVTDIPRRAVTRTARLASLPVGVAGRAALGLGKRLGGRPAEEVTDGAAARAPPSSCSRCSASSRAAR